MIHGLKLSKIDAVVLQHGQPRSCAPFMPALVDLRKACWPGRWQTCHSANFLRLQQMCAAHVPRSPNDDDYVFWFVVVAAYLMVFNFFWLIRHLLALLLMTERGLSGSSWNAQVLSGGTLSIFGRVTSSGVPWGKMAFLRRRQDSAKCERRSIWKSFWAVSRPNSLCWWRGYRQGTRSGGKQDLGKHEHGHKLDSVILFRSHQDNRNLMALFSEIFPRKFTLAWFECWRAVLLSCLVDTISKFFMLPAWQGSLRCGTEGHLALLPFASLEKDQRGSKVRKMSEEVFLIKNRPFDFESTVSFSMSSLRNIRWDHRGVQVLPGLGDRL